MSDLDRKSRLTGWFTQWRIPLRKFLAAKGAARTADLDDVAQEVFLRLLRYDKGDIVEHPQAYLYKMASNVAAEWAIRSRNQRPHRSKWLENLSAENLPEEELSRTETQLQLAQAIASLSELQREILKLKFAEDLTEMQAAERLAMSPRSLKRQVIKSYAKLRDRMSKEVIEKVPYARE